MNLYTRGVARLEGLTDEQIDLFSNVIDIYNEFSYKVDQDNIDFVDELVMNSIVLNDIEKRAMATAIELGVSGPVFSYCYYYPDIEGVVLHPTSSTFWQAKEHSPTLARLLEQAWLAAGMQDGVLLQLMVGDTLSAIKSPADDARYGVVKVSEEVGTAFAAFFPAIGIAKWKMKMKSVLNNDEAIQIVKDLYSNEYCSFRNLELATGEGYVDLYEEESFNPAFAGVVIQRMLKYFDRNDSVVFTYAETDDDTVPDKPAGGLVIVDRDNLFALDGLWFADTVIAGGLGLLDVAGQGHLNVDKPWQCPFCKCPGIEGDMPEVDGWIMSQKLYCTDCSAEWSNHAPIMTMVVHSRGDKS